MSNIIPFKLRLPPEFIEPANISNMTEQQQLELLQEIRNRRMVAVTQYLTIQAERKKVQNEEFAKKYDRGIQRISIHIKTIDNSLVKIEEYLYKLRGVRLEAMEEVDEREVTGT